MKTAAEFSLRDLQQHLLAGEKIEIRRLDQQKSYLQLQGDSAQALDQKALLIRLINWLPVEKRIWRLERKEVLNTAAFPVEFSLTGDQRSALQNLTIVAARISWYVAAMLLALLLAWGLLEVNIMRRITLLSKRAKALSSHVKASQGIDQFNLNDLRSADELGVLASCLQDLLRRVPKIWSGNKSAQHKKKICGMRSDTKSCHRCSLCWPYISARMIQACVICNVCNRR
jgi:hypothetical protein